MYFRAYRIKKYIIEWGKKMLVYIVDKNGDLLIPTRRLGKVHRWLKQGQPVYRCPTALYFTSTL